MYTVKAIETTSYGTQWIISDTEGQLVELPCKYLKHLWVIGKSSNTQKSYAYALKYLSEFLDVINMEYTEVNMKELFQFLAWLQDPTVGTNIIELKKGKPARSPRTVNTYMAAVMSFYRYLFSMGHTTTDFDKKYLQTPAFTGSERPYKDFLYHTHKGENLAKSVFHVKEPRKKVEVLSPDEVHVLVNSTTNIRDKFLIYLLFVSGLRIGELLSLFNEDLVFDLKSGHRIQLTDRGLLSNGGKLKTGPRSIYINQQSMDLYDDYQYETLDSFDKDSNFLFVKIKGENIGEPMDYNDVMSLFRRLKKKTGIDVHPHSFRHTHATMYYAKTRDAKLLQERLGHKDIQTTLNTYVHPTPEDILNDWEKAVASFNMEV